MTNTAQNALLVADRSVSKSVDKQALLSHANSTKHQKLKKIYPEIKQHG
jgi:hypothetical protein